MSAMCPSRISSGRRRSSSSPSRRGSPYSPSGNGHGPCAPIGCSSWCADVAAMTRLARPPLSALEQSLGHAFRDRALLEQALTHISVTAAGRRIDSYQRLEFLGDRVLGLAVADMLYQAFPDDEEGALSRRLSELVRQETCAAVAVDWGVGPHLRLGQGEVASG